MTQYRTYPEYAAGIVNAIAALNDAGVDFITVFDLGEKFEHLRPYLEASRVDLDSVVVSQPDSESLVELVVKLAEQGVPMIFLEQNMPWSIIDG